ncbi:ATP-dependent helicase [Candidatus Amesbacteria bacterium]|nr:ATP-dependent helicase [Candidatus Amesbacteria bacterium]
MDKTLNPQQLEAIKYESGPLLVVAGAGTGKTTVITERIKYLLSSGLALLSEILALTFTEKAAAEMQDRLDEVMPLGYSRMFIGTFHSFCEQFLRDEGINIGLDYEFDLLTEVDAVALFKKNIYKFDLNYYRPLGNPHRFIEAILKHFSRLKDEDVSPNEYIKFVKEPNDIELANLYKDWEQIKADNSVMEFADLIYYTLHILINRPNIAQKYQEKYKYILVDEYQDTNYAQNQILQILAHKRRNITVVADDDQAVYRFRGAAVGNVLSFFETYKNAKTIVLTQNYRSGQKILDAAYKLIGNNNPDRLEIKANIDKKLVALPDKPTGDVIFQKFARGEDEAEWVCNKINQLINDSISYKDIAILVRSNSQAEPFVKALDRAGIPAQFLGPAQLFFQPEIKDLIAILRTIDNPDDDISLYRVLAMDIWKIDKNYLADLFAKTRHTGKTLFEICSDLNIGAILFLKSAIQKSSNNSAGQILYDFLVDTKILLTIEDDNKAKNIAKFFKRIKSFEDNRDASVRTVVDWIDLNTQMGESPQASIDSDWRQNDAVNILTVHSAKGLEFEMVFMANLVMDRFPSRNRSEQLPIPPELIKEQLPELDFHLQEERRLFYVGMTRAKSRLYLTASDYYGETKRAKKVSVFVNETEVAESKNEYHPSSLRSVSPLNLRGDNNAVQINSLSYSHITSFEECPAHYKAKYILGIPEPATAMTTLGTVVHKALNSDNPLKTYRSSWRDAGFMSPQQRKETKKLGEELIIKYLTDEKYSKHKPKYTEHQFSIPISNDLKITGRMDRVDVWEDGTVEIIDYKTGKQAEQKEVDKNLQLSFYAIAAEALNLGPKIKLTLYFFQTGEAISTFRTPEQLEKARAEILKIRDEIQNSDFSCTGFYCSSCAFKMLCDKK